MEADEYWTEDVEIGEATIGGERYGVRLALHRSEERFREHSELVGLARRTGTRTYFHAKPYILEPDLMLTVGLLPRPVPGGAIGAVESAEWEGLRRVEVGQAQAWYYPEDRLLVVWECYLEGRYRRGVVPAEDEAHVALWEGFERALLGRLPRVDRLVTTWEDIYGREEWDAFLVGRGYRRIAPAAFAREPRPAEGDAAGGG